MSENRKSIRIHSDVVVDVASGTEAVLFHKIRDLGEGGMSLEFPSVEAVGTQVELSISLPGLDAVLECSGEVVRATADPVPVLGIRFIGLTDEQKSLLRRFLAFRGGDAGGAR